PIQPPPPPDTLHREFRRVVADPYVDHGPIVPDIIDPIGNGLALAPGRPIMHIDFVGLPFGSPRATPIFKGSYELFFLGISEMLRLYEFVAVPEYARLPLPVLVSGC